MKSPKHVRIILIVLAITVWFSFLHGLGSAPLFDEDEGAFSEATREMMASGNYVITHLNGALRFDKPILIYWLQAASIKLLGLNELALRLPSALASIAWAAMLFLFVRRYCALENAFLSTFFMVTALQVTIIAKAAIADALLNLFVAASMFCLYRYYETNGARFLYGIFLSAALGMLTKGPVAILIPGAVSFLFFLCKKDLKRWLKAVTNPVGILIFLVVAGPWYVLAYLDQGKAFIDGFFLKHNVNRFRTSFEGHAGSLFYYIPVVLAGVIPYTTLLIRGVREGKSVIKNDLGLFCVLWFGFVLVFFSLSGTKLPHYVIYGYSPLFILMPSFLEGVRTKWALLLPAFVLVGVLIIAPCLLPMAAERIHDPYTVIILRSFAETIGPVYWASVLAVAGVLVFVLLSASVSKTKALLTAGFSLLLLVNLTAMPLAASVLQEPVKEAAMIAKAQGYDVVMWKLNVFSFLVYTEKTAETRTPRAGDVVLTRADKLDRIKSYDLLYRKNGVALVKVKEFSGS